MPLCTPSSELDDEDYFEDLADPYLDARWERITEIVGTMRTRGEEAVVRLREEVKPSQRVLGWEEMEVGGEEAGEEEGDRSGVEVQEGVGEEHGER